MVKAHAFAPKRASKAKIQNSMILRENSNKPESPAHTLGEVTHRQVFLQTAGVRKIIRPHSKLKLYDNLEEYIYGQKNRFTLIIPIK